MCLAIPGKVVELLDNDPPFTAALVEFGGVRRQVSLACVPEALIGDYVLVHAGVAISRINAEEAEKVLAALEELELDEEFPEQPAVELGHQPR
jgi:hydrogenase expression/formation protein HypC